MKSYLQKLKTWPWEIRLLLGFAALSILPIFISFWDGPSPRGPIPTLDTHIPKGFVLVPIEIENYEAVDSILGRFGVVDLFRSSENRAQNQPLAVNIRLLRAPLNPSHFAVLVPESEAPKILSHSGSYVVVVKRPDSLGTKFVNTPEKPKRKILYGGD